MSEKKVKYVAKSTLEKAALLKFESKIIIFDTEEDAIEACNNMNSYHGISVTHVPIDEDIALSLLYYCCVAVAIRNTKASEEIQELFCL